jgi:hypothetical protein
LEGLCEESKRMTLEVYSIDESVVSALLRKKALVETLRITLLTSTTPHKEKQCCRGLGLLTADVFTLFGLESVPHMTVR